MSSHSHFRLKLVVIALTLLYSGLSFSQSEDVVVNPITPGSLPALGADNLSSNVYFPLSPRLNVSGGMGNNNYGAADVMAPLFGSTSAIIYTDLGGQTGKGKSNFLSLGFGARDAVNDDIMWGGYAFVDRSKANDTAGGNHWTVINPGVEFMTNSWDGRVNAYIPTGNKENTRGPFFGTQVNMPSAVTFNAHDEYSQLFNKVDEIGPGLDADAGYTFTSLRRFRVHGGGYFFSLSDTGDISGGEVGAEMPINNYATLLLDDSYDNVQQNTTVVSVRFTLGGVDKFANDPTVQDRILDPIYRHLGALSTNTGIPSNHALVEIDNTPVLEQSNIWFYDANSSTAFNPSAGLNNCTFEHPCRGQDFSQGNVNFINGIDPKANFYFRPGTYTIAAPKNLNLNSGQSMYGRDITYTMPASAATGFPTFVGEIDPQGNNTLDSFALINNAGSQSIGIHVSNTNNVLMNNLQIGQMNAQGGYPTSIQVDNASNITVQNSVIQSSLPGSATGLLNNGGATTINNNIFNIAQATGTSRNVGEGVTNNGTASINNNIFNLTDTGTSSNFTNGIVNTGTLSLNSNTFTITAPNGDRTMGIVNNGSGTVNLNSNNFTQSSNVSNVGIDNSLGTIGAITGVNNTFTITGSGTNVGFSNAVSFYPGNGNTCTINGVAC